MQPGPIWRLKAGRAQGDTSYAGISGKLEREGTTKKYMSLGKAGIT